MLLYVGRSTLLSDDGIIEICTENIRSHGRNVLLILVPFAELQSLGCFCTSL